MPFMRVLASVFPIEVVLVLLVLLLLVSIVSTCIVIITISSNYLVISFRNHSLPWLPRFQMPTQAAFVDPVKSFC